MCWFIFFFNDTATTETYTLSLHYALPIFRPPRLRTRGRPQHPTTAHPQDRKSTRLNSSHPSISYAVFCLKKKKPHIQLLSSRHKKAKMLSLSITSGTL